KWARRRPTLAAAYVLTAAVLLLTGFGTLLAMLWQRAESARAVADVARGDAEIARGIAEDALKGELVAKGSEAKLKERVERLNYARTVELAQQQWKENDVARARALLAACRPELRGRDRRYVHRLCHDHVVRCVAHTGAVMS